MVNVLETRSAKSLQFCVPVNLEEANKMQNILMNTVWFAIKGIKTEPLNFTALLGIIRMQNDPVDPAPCGSMLGPWSDVCHRILVRHSVTSPPPHPRTHTLAQEKTRKQN